MVLASGTKNITYKIHKPHLYSCSGKGTALSPDIALTMGKRCPLFAICLMCLQENQKSNFLLLSNL